MFDVPIMTADKRSTNNEENSRFRLRGCGSNRTPQRKESYVVTDVAGYDIAWLQSATSNAIWPHKCQNNFKNQINNNIYSHKTNSLSYNAKLQVCTNLVAWCDRRKMCQQMIERPV